MERGVADPSKVTEPSAEGAQAPALTRETVAVVVPHTHWDREWYAPFETMRFHLLRFLDELVDVLEAQPDLVFVLDGQTVILEDYLEIRRDQAERVAALVAAGRLRPGPFYVQPDEFHVSGEALVRNLLIGCRMAAAFGWVMREGYLPDTFGHVHQLPQVLRGFGIGTFYAMRGLGSDADELGNEFWWQAPDGSRVLVTWLRESYSNAGVLTRDPDRMPLHHGTLCRYDTLHELLDRLGSRSPSGVLLLLNGGDHLRIQADVGDIVRSLDAAVGAEVRLGGLEEFHALRDERPAPDAVIRGELRHGLRHDVFDGIGSTRTPMKAHNARVEALVAGRAERLDALATLVDGRTNRPAVEHLWRELVKNYAHDSICGCSVDEVHDEMTTRFNKIGQLATAVAADAAGRIARGVTPAPDPGEVPVVVVNPSAFPRSGAVTVDVVADFGVPLGRRVFGWQQGDGVDWADLVLLDGGGRPVPFEVEPAGGVTVTDILDRRKEVHADHVRFVTRDVPPLGVTRYRLVPAGRAGATPATPTPPTERPVRRTGHTLENDAVSVRAEADGTLSLTHKATGRVLRGLLELLDDGDAGDEYGFGPLVDDHPRSSRNGTWTVEEHPGSRLILRGVMAVPRSLAADRTERMRDDDVDLAVTLVVGLQPDADRVDVDVTVDNTARDHRLRLRMPTGIRADHSIAESAFGVIRRGTRPVAAEGWRDRPSGVRALQRFVAVTDDGGGVQILTEGLHEYALDGDGRLDLTLLRAVGWLSRMDHPRRPHKIGPELPTPGAQCPGTRTFRIALRPLGPDTSTGALYRAAEEFSVPLVAACVQGRPDRRPVPDGATPLGLEIEPDAIVLSALKTAEDGDGLIVRIFNSEDVGCTARVRTQARITGAWRCNLEERDPQPLEAGPDWSLTLPLGPAEIATLRLHLATPHDRRTGHDLENRQR